MRTIEAETDIAEGVAYLCDREPRFAIAINAAGNPPLRRGKPGLEGLCHIITAQQISIHAADSIWKRVSEHFSPFDADEMIAASDKAYIDCGLSRPKIRTIRALLEAIASRKLDFQLLHQSQDADVAKALTAIRGIGPWTAEIYLLTAMGRTDIWPKGDLALQEAARLLFDLEQRPDTKQMHKMAENWQPWRAVAARILWSYYRHIKL